MKKLIIFIQILALSFLLNISLWGLFSGRIIKKIFIESEYHFLIPITIVSLIFSIVYLLTFNIICKFKIKSLVLIFIMSLVSYGISLFIGESIAAITNNFFDTMNCRGPGCIALVMTLFGDLSLIVVPAFLVLITWLFRHHVIKSIENKN